MAVASQCPYDPGCETDCAREEVGQYLHLTVEPDRRRLLAALEELQGTWMSVDEFVLHLRSLSTDHPIDRDREDLVGGEFPQLEDLGLLALDTDDGRFLYCGCPLVADVVSMVTR